MKVTNPEVIKNGEGELIDAITADVDWGAIEKIFTEKHKLAIEEDVEYKNGDLVVYNNQIAYKLEFDIKVTLSVLLDREGNYISISGSGDSKTTGENGDVNAAAESIQDHDGDEDIIDEVLSGTQMDEVSKNDDIIGVVSHGDNHGPDDAFRTDPENDESKTKKKGSLSMV